MRRYFITRQTRQKKEETHSKKSVHLTSISSHVSHKINYQTVRVSYILTVFVIEKNLVDYSPELIIFSASLSGIPFNSLKLIYFSAGLSEIQFNSLKFPRIMGSGAQIILKRKGDLMMQETMPHWLTRQAFLAPDKLALEMPGGDAWTFTTLRNECELFARKLTQLSIQKGDKVVILSNNHLDAVRAIFACSYLGVVAVMLNKRLTQQELHYQLANAEVDILLTRPALQEEKQLDFSKQYTFTDVHELKERDIALIDEINLADPFTMMFTSGTTGNPRSE